MEFEPGDLVRGTGSIIFDEGEVIEFVGRNGGLVDGKYVYRVKLLGRGPWRATTRQAFARIYDESFNDPGGRFTFDETQAPPPGRWEAYVYENEMELITEEVMTMDKKRIDEDPDSATPDPNKGNPEDEV